MSTQPTRYLSQLLDFTTYDAEIRGLIGDAGDAWGEITGSLTDQADLTAVLTAMSQARYDGDAAISQNLAVVVNDLGAHLTDTANPHQVTAAQSGAEPALGNPEVDGHVLSSLADGTRAWVSPQSGAQGIQGIQGEPGADGAAGADGAPGPNLVNGSTATAFTGFLKGNGSAVMEVSALGTGTVVLTAGTINSTLGQTYTLPTTSATLAITSGAQTFAEVQTFTDGITLGTSGNLFGGANTIDQRNGANAQALRVFNTFTSASVNEYAYIAWASNKATFGAYHTGATHRTVQLLGFTIELTTGTVVKWVVQSAGHLVANANNSYDIGSSTLAPRSIYAGTSFLVAGTKVLGAQAAAEADVTGGTIIDTQARATLNSILAKLRTHGIIAT